MNICYKCQAQTRAGTRNAVGAWLCNKCALTNHTLHYDYYDAETDSMKTPFNEMDEKEQSDETRQCSKTSMGIFYRAHHVYYRAACRAGKGAGGCADSGKNDLYGI